MSVFFFSSLNLSSTMCVCTKELGKRIESYSSSWEQRKSLRGSIYWKQKNWRRLLLLFCGQSESWNYYPLLIIKNFFFLIMQNVAGVGCGPLNQHPRHICVPFLPKKNFQRPYEGSSSCSTLWGLNGHLSDQVFSRRFHIRPPIR